jgi:hypothetical protein
MRSKRLSRLSKLQYMRQLLRTILNDSRFIIIILRIPFGNCTGVGHLLPFLHLMNLVYPELAVHSRQYSSTLKALKELKSDVGVISRKVSPSQIRLRIRRLKFQNRYSDKKC